MAWEQWLAFITASHHYSTGATHIPGVALAEATYQNLHSQARIHPGSLWRTSYRSQQTKEHCCGYYFRPYFTSKVR